MSTGDKIIYWGTLVLAWTLLPFAMARVAFEVATKYVDKTITEFER